MSCGRPARPSSSTIRCCQTASPRSPVAIGTYAYVREGTETFLTTFGPAQYRSAAQYAAAVGSPLDAVLLGEEPDYARFGDVCDHAAPDRG